MWYTALSFVLEAPGVGGRVGFFGDPTFQLNLVLMFLDKAAGTGTRFFGGLNGTVRGTTGAVRRVARPAGRPAAHAVGVCGRPSSVRTSSADGGGRVARKALGE